MRRDNRRRNLDWLNFCGTDDTNIVKLAICKGSKSIPYMVGVRNANTENSPYFNLIMCAHVTFTDSEYSDSYYFHSFKRMEDEDFYDNY